MFTVSVRDGRGQPVSSTQINDTRCTVGSQTDCQVVLSGWKVAKVHAEFILRDDGVHVLCRTKLKSLRVNDNSVEHYGPLTLSDTITIGDYMVKVRIANSAASDGDDDAAAEREILQRRTREKVYLVVSRALAAEIQAVPEEMLHAHIRQQVAQAVEAIRNDEIDRSRLTRDVVSELLGYGPLDRLLEMPDVNEIMVNAHDEIFYQTENGVQRATEIFSSDEALLDIIRRMVSHTGRRIDAQQPMIDARLRDGSRVNAVIPPLSTKGPSLTIRRFKTDRLTMAHLINYGTLNSAMARFLELCVRNKRNIVIAGGTASGKSTLLNILAAWIGEHERIITIEDAAELHLPQPNLVSLETRTPDMDGRGGVSVRDLVRNSLRMSPDRIVIGECRGGEALDMLQAMNTGHDGSLTTVHANTPRDCLNRLEMLALMSGVDLQATAIRNQIQSSIQLVVQQSRFPCGSRKITSICEVTGMESGNIQIGEIFRFQQDGVDGEGKVVGRFLATGVVPVFLDRLRERGVKIDYSMFE